MAAPVTFVFIPILSLIISVRFSSEELNHSLQVSSLNRPQELYRRISKADEPYNLQVAHINQTQVLLGWDFTIPPGLEANEIGFVINYTKLNGQSKIHTERDGKARRFELCNLDNGADYTVEVTPEAKGRPLSAPAHTTFITMNQDWQPVVLESNKITKRERNSVTYEMVWGGASHASSLRYEFQVCTTRCQLHHSLESNLTLTLKYNERYNVTVTAVYAQPMTRIKRTSLVHKDWSAPGAPSEVRELWKVDQRRDTLLLRWRAPEFPNGPISFYKLNVGDALNPSRTNEFRVDTTEYEARVPIPRGKYYHAEISAVNEHAGSEFTGKPAKFLIEFTKPGKPAHIEIVHRRSDFVGLCVTPPEKSFPDDFYKVQAKQKSVEGYTQNCTTIGLLVPYETVYVTVSTCFNDVSNGTFCGDRLYSSITSNVEAPSEVLNLSAAYSESGKPALYWSAPEHKRGPIDGYIINIIDSAKPDFIFTNETVGPDDREFEFKAAEGAKSYAFFIAAFNVDLNTGDRVIGKKLPIEPPSGLATWIVAIIAIASATLLCMMALQIVARKRDLSESKLRFLVLVPSSKRKTG